MKTDCLINANGTNDESIKPEGLAEYKVPPPSVVDAARECGSSNNNEVQPVQENETNKYEESDGFVCPDDQEGERNAFDCIDNITRC